ncbi:MAG: DUF1349 domain-containing protein, partial [Thermoflexales bacterium]|nr:DUF1349 domain-containing protein [Thermoflexales bacterium]
VIGRVFFYRVLAAIAGAIAAAERELDDHLLTLQQQEMIRERAREPELEYIFKHHLTQEAAYNGLLKQERRVFHRQVAEALERLFAERLDEQMGLLAFHWERAEEAGKATPCLLRAGTLAAAVYANEEAIAYFRRALKLIESPLRNGALPQKGAATEQQLSWRIEALSKLGQVLLGISELDQASDCLQEAIALGQGKLPPCELVRLYYWLCEVLWWQNRRAEAARLAHDGLALLGTEDESVEAALMNKHVASNHWVMGDTLTMQEFTRRNERFIQRLPYTEELRPVYTDIATEYAFIDNDPGEALRWLGILERHAAQHHDLRALGEVQRFTAYAILSRTGDLHGAISHYRQALESFRRTGDTKHVCECLAWMAETYLALGELEQAKACTDEAALLAQTPGSRLNVVDLNLTAGLILACQNAPDQALKAFRSTLETEAGPVDLRYEWRIVFYAAQVHLAQGKPAEALRELERGYQQTTLFDDAKNFPYMLARLLNSLEEAHADPAAFRALCQRVRLDWGEPALPLVQWYLEPAAVAEPGEPAFEVNFSFPLDPAWSWRDPMGDCSYRVQDGLEIHVPNGRGLWGINLSAPRLLRSVTGDWSVQVASSSVSPEQPATGGLLVWKDDKNFMRLDRGKIGRREIAFLGCQGGQDILVGRGCLSFQERVWLRLERRGEELRAFCSADGRQWFTAGHVNFPAEDPLQVGMYVIGDIDFTVYQGAYRQGASLRFTSFGLFA